MSLIPGAKFYSKECRLFYAANSEGNEEMLDNFKEVIVEENIASEIKVIDINTIGGYKMATEMDVPEVPCLLIGKRYYFRDDIVSKERLRRVLKKNG